MGDWEPPPCYYAPQWSASEFKAWWEDVAEPAAYKTDNENADGIVEQHKQTYGEDSKYEDYNIEREDEGAWWTARSNPNAPGGGSITTCNEPIFWHEHDDPLPDHVGMPDAQLLAELAYAHVDIPDLDVELNPEEDQTVGLDTWVWLEAANLAPVSVTARVDGFEGLSSTVTAVPVGLELDPGTEDAEVLHGAEGCVVGEDGGVGEPYVEGRAEDTPPCGVRYLRATHGSGAYTLTAALTWEISWEGSDGAGGDLPDGRFEATQEVTVEEVQAIVR